MPKQHQLGDLEIRITADIDKEGEARTLELTPLARLELEAIAPPGGLIFGRYDYRRTLRKAQAYAPRRRLCELARRPIGSLKAVE